MAEEKLFENQIKKYFHSVGIYPAGYHVTFHVHDEVIVEAQDGSHLANVAEIMGQPIDWAPGLLLRGEGYVTPFYMKD